MARAKKRMTNEQFVKSLMTYSKYGALSQLFVLDALDKMSNRVAEADPKELDSGLVNGEAWVGVAKEIKERLAEHYRS